MSVLTDSDRAEMWGMCGGPNSDLGGYPVTLERIALHFLVAGAKRERERCAKMAEDWQGENLKFLADAIRDD